MTTMKSVARRWATAAALGLLAGRPGTAAAQTHCEDPEAGTLGITGLACESCSFSRSRSGFTEAEFLTEPRVIRVDEAGVGGDRVRAGDVIVAIDGRFITTAEGAARLTGLRAGQRVRITVRRDGRERQLDLTAGRACDIAPAEPLPPSPRPPAEPLPPTSRSPAAEPSLPELPALPATPAMPRPTAILGFSIRCGDCGYQTDGAGGSWFFSEPPEVHRVEQGSPAERAGLRPGDRLVAIDGQDIVTPEGARRFSSVAPGEPVRWTVVRDGRRLEPVTLVGRASATAQDQGRLRYTGALGATEIEVFGAPVTVTEDAGRGEIVIRSADLVVRLRAPGAAGVRVGGAPPPGH